MDEGYHLIVSSTATSDQPSWDDVKCIKVYKYNNIMYLGEW